MNNAKILNISNPSKGSIIAGELSRDLHKKDTGIRQAVKWIIAFNEKHTRRMLIFRRIRNIFHILFIAASASVFIVNTPNVSAYLIIALLIIGNIMLIRIIETLLEGLKRRHVVYLKRKLNVLLLRYAMKYPESMTSAMHADIYKQLLYVKGRGLIQNHRPGGILSNKRWLISKSSRYLLANALKDLKGTMLGIINNTIEITPLNENALDAYRDSIIIDSFVNLFSFSQSVRKTASDALSYELMMLFPDMIYFIWRVYKGIADVRYKFQDTSSKKKDEK